MRAKRRLDGDGAMSASANKRPKTENESPHKSPVQVTESRPQPQAWTLDASDIPASAKKIYCILRGRQPGFYYEWSVAEKEVSGFGDNVYMSFPRGSKKASLRTVNVDDVVRDAITYMNHTFESCTYGCGGKCRAPTTTTTTTTIITPAGDEPRASPPPERPREMRDRSKCRICRERCKVPNGQVCAICFASPELAEEIEDFAKIFELDKTQTCALGLIARGKNIFFTGAAGTGKSRILQAASAFFKHFGLYAPVVAPTGIAALAVNGTTLHTYAAWTAKLSGSSLDALRDVAHKTRTWKRFNDTDVLVIDEISMIENDTLTRLSAMMEDALVDSCPFGGVQVVITGDFYQLPPVKPFRTCLYCGGEMLKKYDGGPSTCEGHGLWYDHEKWAFQSPVWPALNLINVELKQVHRQADPDYTDILHRMRLGAKLTASQENALLRYKEDFKFDSAIKLMPRRKDVNTINAYHMDELHTPALTYSCVDHFQWENQHPEYADPFPVVPDSHRYEDSLELKEGMQVLLLANLDLAAGLANGTIGKIIGFVPMYERNLPRAKKNWKATAANGEVPTTHEHRDYAEMRIRDFMNQARDTQWPIVKFQNGLVRIVHAHCSITELGKDRPYSLLSRTQIPLLAGWAITIHKSQGMTLENVVATLDGCFAPGQAYVALSRSKTLEGMAVQTLPSPSKLRVDSTVQEFMKKTFGT